jgi:transposase
LRHTGEKAFPGHGNAVSQEAEIASLRRALAEAQQERDILKKATAFFAKQLP